MRYNENAISNLPIWRLSRWMYAITICSKCWLIKVPREDWVCKGGWHQRQHLQAFPQRAGLNGCDGSHLQKDELYLWRCFGDSSRSASSKGGCRSEMIIESPYQRFGLSHPWAVSLLWNEDNRQTESWGLVKYKDRRKNRPRKSLSISDREICQEHSERLPCSPWCNEQWIPNSRY